MLTRLRPLRVSSLVFLLALPALSAVAQEPPTSVAANNQAELTRASLTGTSGAEATAVSSSQLLALQAQLDQVQQRAARAEERAQVAEQKVAVVAVAPVTTAGDKGFVLRSPDNAFAVRFKGLVAFDGKAFTGDPAASAGNGFTVRKLRPVFEATVLNWADLRLMPDFAGSRATVVDAFIDVRPTSWFKIRAGKFIAPVGLERSEQDTELALVERSLTANLSQVRDIGVVLHLDPLGGFLHLEAGVVNGGGDNTNLDSDNNKQKDAVGRFLFQPFRLPSLARLGALAVGIAGSSGVHRGAARADGTALGTFVAAGQNTFFQYLASATDATAVVYADGLHRRLNPQAFYYLGPVGLLGEYTLSQQRVTRNATSARLTHRAWHATANFVIGGKPSINGVTVTDRFAPAAGQFGAIELSARYGQLKVDPDSFPVFADASKSAARAQELALGASLYFSRNFKLAFSYDRTSFDGLTGTALARSDEQLFIGRTQFLF
jgi:phosphate-selective porin OprO/OprP